MKKHTNRWKIAFWIFCALWIIQWIVILVAAKEYNYNQTQSQLSSSSSNLVDLQQCVQQAQNSFNEGDYGITTNGAAADFNASVNACKTEYPNN